MPACPRAAAHSPLGLRRVRPTASDQPRHLPAVFDVQPRKQLLAEQASVVIQFSLEREQPPMDLSEVGGRGVVKVVQADAKLYLQPARGHLPETTTSADGPGSRVGLLGRLPPRPSIVRRPAMAYSSILAAAVLACTVWSAAPAMAAAPPKPGTVDVDFSTGYEGFATTTLGGGGRWTG